MATAASQLYVYACYTFFNRQDVVEIPDDVIEIPDDNDCTDSTNVQLDPRCSSISLETTSDLDQLISLFEGELSADQISAIYLLTEKNYEKCFDCLIEGPTIQSMLRSMNVQFRSMPTVKIKVDQESVWADMIAFYKGKGVCRLM